LHKSHCVQARVSFEKIPFLWGNLRLQFNSLRANLSQMAAEFDLSGEWIGHYTGHYDEVIRITQQGEALEAVKITGDDYVPAGSVTWRANLRTGRGEGQIAEKEFRNARFVPGTLTIVSPERIVFTWDNLGTVEYRKDD
jgi:hypothetical protein